MHLIVSEAIKWIIIEYHVSKTVTKLCEMTIYKYDSI